MSFRIQKHLYNFQSTRRKINNLLIMKTWLRIERGFVSIKCVLKEGHSELCTEGIIFMYRFNYYSFLQTRV